MLAVWLLGLAIVAHHDPVAGADTAVWRWWVQHRSPGTTAVVSAVTILFSPVWVGIWTIVAAGVLVVRDRVLVRAAQLVATVGAIGLLCEIVKLAVGRARPPVAQQIGGPEVTLSFPSGHVAGAAALALGLAAVVTAHSSRARRIVSITIAAGVAVIAAVTRLYLGMHWVTDVAASIVLAAGLVGVIPEATTTALSHLDAHVSERFRPLIDPAHARDGHTPEELTRCTATH
ncbi:MAG: phosphatase PAP2 family protein [Gordonia paraffinivorans]